MSRNEPARLFALLGAPVHHSLSPTLQNAAFGATGMRAVYVALHTWKELVEPLMRELAARRGGGNVTVPHKARAARAVDRPSEAARATGACNTFWWDEADGLCGDNTDVEGFGAAARHVLGTDLGGCRLLLVGAGGAARAVAFAGVQAGAGRIDIHNRTVDRAERLVRDLGSPSVLSILARLDQARSTEYDLVVNATSLGIRPGDPLPLDPSTLRASTLLDLTDGEDEAPWVAAARRAGWHAEDGRRMLVEQAAAAFERWSNRQGPREVMLEAAGLGTA